jgi:hypothetical protein
VAPPKKSPPEPSAPATQRVLEQAALDSDRRVDGLGRRLLYFSDGELFVLVGLGRDGQTDGTNYLAVREKGTSLPCQNLDSDQFASDRGWHRRCGK